MKKDNDDDERLALPRFTPLAATHYAAPVS
jgi:hypothetical protein